MELFNEEVENEVTKTEKAVTWAVGIANDDSHGYDQGANRWKQDYDCSALVIQAWEQAGVPVKTAGATYTGNMKKIFLANGFADVTKSVNLTTGTGLQRGDVLLKEARHTAMSIGSGQIVQASINEKGGTTGGRIGDQTGREIWTRSYYNYTGAGTASSATPGNQPPRSSPWTNWPGKSWRASGAAATRGSRPSRLRATTTRPCRPESMPC